MLKRIIEFFKKRAERKRKERKELEKLAGVWDPHPFITRKTLSELFTLVPKNSITHHREDPQWGLCKLPEHLRLFTIKPDNVDGYKCIRIYCEVLHVYSAPGKSVLAGCHGRHSLEAARHMGGDTGCGGGMKHRFAPRWTGWTAKRQLSQTLANRWFEGYTIMYHHGWRGSWFDLQGSLATNSLYFTNIYTGTPQDVARYMLYMARPGEDISDYTFKLAQDSFRDVIEAGGLMSPLQFRTNVFNFRAAKMTVALM